MGGSFKFNAVYQLAVKGGDQDTISFRASGFNRQETRGRIGVDRKVCRDILMDTYIAIDESHIRTSKCA